MNRSLRVSLTSLLIALSLIPAIVVGAALGWGIFQRERAHVIELERRVTDQAADQITTYLDGAETELYTLIQDPALRGDDPAAREAVLSDALFYRGTFDELEIIDAAGAELARASRIGIVATDNLHDHRADAIFVEPMRLNKTYYQGFEVSQLNGEPLLRMAVPTLDVQSGSPDGVLIASVRMRQVFDRVTSLPLGLNGTMMVTDADGHLIAHPNLTAFADAIPQPSAVDGVALGVTGEQVLQVRRPISIGNLSLSISAEQPLANADESLRRSLSMAALLFAGIALAAAAFALIAVGRIARPISDLAAATQRISAGDTTGQVAVSRHDEIGALQRDFNQMVSDLRAQRAAIDERTEALQSSLDRQRDLLETVAQLSSPLLPVWEGVVVLPIVGHVDAQRGAALTTTLVEGVAQRRARVAILDITGLATVNDEVVATLLRAAQAVELLGAHAMLAGVSAAFAQRIVTKTVNLAALESYRDLQSAAESAITRLDGRQVAR
ncbi:MAG: HAMP domain-containing protein [Chloroflexales bacterium]|nr:HAMP domain-containing protein [Chloroflexales bacterium]